MNWLIIASNKYENEVENLQNFLIEKKHAPKVYFILDNSISNPEQFYVDLHQVSHCVFISDGTVPLNPPLFYATGYLNGAEIPVFVVGKTQNQDEKNKRENDPQVQMGISYLLHEIDQK